MNQYNRYFSTIWGVLSPISMAFWLWIKDDFNWTRWLEYTIGMLFLYLIYNSRSLRYKGNQTMLFAVGLIILGQAFRIMHWPYTFELLIVGTLFLCIAYTIFYFRNTKKNILDSLKLIWLFAAAIRMTFYLFRFPIIPYFDMIIGVLIVIIYSLVAHYELIGKDQSEIEIDEENLPEDIL
jgi:asparagine N-glycosylation enzyme membrane subunit Stt3